MYFNNFFRINYLRDELIKHNIKLVGYSTDGDGRCQASMKNGLCLKPQTLKPNVENQSLLKEYFFAKTTEFYYFQDHEHIISRLRKMILADNGMTIGNFSIRLDVLKVNN